MTYHRPHSDQPFTLEENELHLLHDLLFSRIREAASPPDSPSAQFRHELLYKLIDAMIWARNGKTVIVGKQDEDIKALHKALNSVLSLFVSQHGYDFNCVDAGLEALARNSERLPVTAAFEERIAAIRKEEAE